MPKQASIVFKFYQSLLIIGKYTFMENCLLVAVLSDFTVDYCFN